jgi:hypothetical protein
VGADNPVVDSARYAKIIGVQDHLFAGSSSGHGGKPMIARQFYRERISKWGRHRDADREFTPKASDGEIISTYFRRAIEEPNAI